MQLFVMKHSLASISELVKTFSENWWYLFYFVERVQWFDSVAISDKILFLVLVLCIFGCKDVSVVKYFQNVLVVSTLELGSDEIAV